VQVHAAITNVIMNAGL